MTSSHSRDPLDHLSRSEKRSWRAAERRIRRLHEAEQMAALRAMAATRCRVTGVLTPVMDAPENPMAGVAPAEMVIAGHRLRAGRVSHRSLATLREALAGLANVPLTAVSRYGPYWVLTFKLATEPLVVLADHLTLLPDRSGPGGRGVPVGPLATAGF